MIKQLHNNSVIQCIQLMEKSLQYNQYEAYPENQRCWIQHLTKHIEEQVKENPHYIAVGDFDDGQLHGFLLASSFKNYYTQQYVMDVKDCIVDHSRNSVYTVTRLFDHMIDHTEHHGGMYWRADTIRTGDAGIKYVEFLAKKYNAIPFHGVHGRV